MRALDSLKIRVRGVWLPVPGFLWRRQIANTFQQQAGRLAEMPSAQREIRALVVTELSKAGRPLTPNVIARQLNMSRGAVTASLAELEGGMTYLFRDRDGAVEWAYPVTAAPTPHRLTFSSGEEIWAA